MTSLNAEKPLVCWNWIMMWDRHCIA